MSNRPIAAPRRGRSPRRSGTGRLRGVLAVALVLTALGAGAARGEVQDTAGTSPTSGRARLFLGDLQALVGPPSPEQPVEALDDLPPTSLTARIVVENTSGAPLEGARLVVETFGRATSRSELHEVLDGSDSPLGGRGAPVLDEPLPTVAPGDVIQYTLTLNAADAGLVDLDHDVTVRPLVISLALGTVVLDEVRTASVGVARPVQRPVETAIVIALDTPAAATTSPLEVRTAALAPGGRLDRLLRAVERDAAAITVAPAAHTLEDLEAAVAGALPGATSLRDRVRAVSESGPAGVVSGPYALADVPALLSQPATEALAARAVTEGRERLQALTGRTPGAAHLSFTPQTRAALDLAPVDLLIVPWDDAAGPSIEEVPGHDVPVARRSVRTPAGRSIDVLVGDPWITEALTEATGVHGWSVDAHRVVVETAMIFAQRPGEASRSLLVLPPMDWEAPGVLPSEVTARLLAAPWLRVAPAVTVAAQGTVADVPWVPATTPTGPLTPLLPQAGTLEVRIDGVLSALRDVDPAAPEATAGPTDGGAPPPAAAATALSETARDDLLRALSSWPAGGAAPDSTAAALAQLSARVAEVVGEVSVPADSAITLTSERGVIPITVQHPDGAPLEVVVELTTQGRLSFPDGATQVVRLDPGSTSTVSFEASALGRGTFPLAVTVRTPERSVVLARSLVSVRATAVSRPALAVIGGVVLVLLVFGRRRRPASPTLEVVR